MPLGLSPPRRAVCANNLELGLVETNAAVISGVEEELLDPRALAIGVEHAVQSLDGAARGYGADTR
jgi:hypothetical protein